MWLQGLLTDVVFLDEYEYLDEPIHTLWARGFGDSTAIKEGAIAPNIFLPICSYPANQMN
jgi:hypothetical protein